MSTEPINEPGDSEQADRRQQAQPGPNSPDPKPAAEHRTIKRPFHDRMITGAAAGIAAYLDVDPTIVRVGFVALLLFGGAGLPLYVAAWLLIPEEGFGQSIAMDLLDHAKALFGSPSHAGRAGERRN